MRDDDRALTGRVGPVEIDWPRSAGYYGGVTLAVALGLIEWPVGLFLGAIPLVKLLNRGNLPKPVHFAVHVFDGMAKPVGGDAQGTITMVRTPARVRKVAAKAVGEKP